MSTDQKKLEIVASGDRTQATVKLYQETHTMGNAIRYILARQTETDFVGYSIPHPSDPYLNLRLQTRGEPVEKMLAHSLTTISAVADGIETAFDKELARFESQKVGSMTDR